MNRQPTLVQHAFVLLTLVRFTRNCIFTAFDLPEPLHTLCCQKPEVYSSASEVSSCKFSLWRWVSKLAHSLITLLPCLFLTYTTVALAVCLLSCNAVRKTRVAGKRLINALSAMNGKPCYSVLCPAASKNTEQATVLICCVQLIVLFA